MHAEVEIAVLHKPNAEYENHPIESRHNENIVSTTKVKYVINEMVASEVVATV